MTPIRLAGSVLGVATGAVAVYLQFSDASSVPAGAHSIFLAIFGAFLAVDSLISFTGFRVSFIVGAVLSVAVLGVIAALWGDFPLVDSGAVLALAVVTILVDAVASRPARGLSEKDSPLNLPVFG